MRPIKNTCELSTECENPISHVDSGEWLACREHATKRAKAGFKVRELPQDELTRLSQGLNLYA